MPDREGSPRTVPAGRYGTAPRRSTRRVLVWVGVVCAALLLGWVGYAVVRQASPAVRGDAASYSVRGPDRVVVDLGVTRKDPRAPVLCGVSAQNGVHTTVGYRQITVPPGRAHTVLAVDVRTSEPAVSASVEGCWVVPGD